MIDIGTPRDSAPPETLVVEAPGCVLSWPLEASSPIPFIKVSSLADADWLWQLIGEEAYGDLVTGAETTPEWNLELAGILRSLGLRYWAQSWWPASEIDFIPALDQVELARDINALIEELADVIDLDLEEPLLHGVQRSEYALAAGSGPSGSEEPIAEGRAPVAWQAVPPGIVDATEYPLSWRIDARPTVVAHLQVATLPGRSAEAAGLPVRVGETRGVLDESGSAELDIPIAGTEAWTTVWEDVEMRLGVEDSEFKESPELRERIRRYARERAAAEIPAAASAWEQDY